MVAVEKSSESVFKNLLLKINAKMKFCFKLGLFVLVTFCLDRAADRTKSNQKSQESSMLPRTKAYARPLNFQASALKIKALVKYLKNLNML